MPHTTWNQFDLTSPGITLSGGNLIATATIGTGAGVRGVDVQTSGKYYFEYLVTTWSSANTQLGAGTSGTILSIGTKAFVRQDGTIFVNNTSTGTSIGAQTNGSTIGIALDLTNNNIWFRAGAAGNWNNSGTASPATNTGGFSISAMVSGGLFPLAILYATSDSVAANFGDSAFSGVVPGGFTSGFPYTSPQPSAQITQVAIEEWASVALAAITAPNAMVMVMA